LDLPWTHYIHMVETWEEATISFPIIYFGPHYRIACEWLFVLGLQTRSFEICNLQILKFCTLLIFSYEFWLRSFQLQNCIPWQILSKTILHIFIMSFDSYFRRAFTLLPFYSWPFFWLQFLSPNGGCKFISNILSLRALQCYKKTFDLHKVYLSTFISKI